MLETKQKFEEQQFKIVNDKFPHLWNKRSTTPCNIRDINNGIKTNISNYRIGSS